MIVIPVESKVHGLQHFFIDGEDFEKVNKYKWYLSKDKRRDNYYLMYDDRGPDRKGKILLLHRIIMDCPEGLVVDHINHNTLDNRKENLRICNKSQNAMNAIKQKNTKSKYKGVSINKITGKFIAYIKNNGKFEYIGAYSEENAAAIAYNKKAYEYHREFACLNEVENV